MGSIVMVMSWRWCDWKSGTARKPLRILRWTVYRIVWPAEVESIETCIDIWSIWPNWSCLHDWNDCICTLVVIYVVGLGLPATGVTAASVCNLGTLAWHDINACIDTHDYTTLNVWTEGSLQAPLVWQADCHLPHRVGGNFGPPLNKTSSLFLDKEF